jgi:hypothetical protein
VSQSSITPLSSGHLNGQTLKIELVEPAGWLGLRGSDRYRFGNPSIDDDSEAGRVGALLIVLGVRIRGA